MKRLEVDVHFARSALAKRGSNLRDLRKKWEIQQRVAMAEIDKLKAEKDREYEATREEIFRMEEEIKTDRIWLAHHEHNLENGFEK
jgi:hypothetical protein